MFKFILNCQQFDNCPLFATGVIYTSDKFAAIVIDTGGKLRKMVEKFATGVVDTGGKFAAGVIDTGGAP
jgi:hypothetical protein